ncbi:MAG: ATP-binding protein, partial [Ferruginibacter sp.]
MRFLNKVIFINSATVPYAEVMVDGNVHLIGTQGVGKSTLLRAILFFYNADTLKLGISKEKKNFAEYYFPYQNSYLVYEVNRETTPFCILAFKSQGKVCFRFIDGAYQREHYISADGRAFEKWEEIRELLDAKKIDNSRKIDRYEEYRDIIYGNTETGKKEFVKYALLQSKQYQNIPRTIQNVFLNSKLEAEFIKQTIIMSLNEEEIAIDLQSYAHHLKNFENQLNDIHLYKQPHIIKQAENVVKNHLAIRHLESEKNRFAQQLSWAAAQVKRAIPKLAEKKEKLDAEKAGFAEKAMYNEQRFRTRSEKIRGEISVLESDIKKGKERADYYNKMQVEVILERIHSRKEMENELQKYNREKQVLTSHFSEITLKFESLFNGLEQAARSFEQNKKEEVVNYREQAANEKEAARSQLEKSIVFIRLQNKEAIEQSQVSAEQQQTILQQERIKKASITHQRFFEKELANAKDTTAQYKLALQENGHEIEHFKMLVQTLQKQWELDEQAAKQSIERQQEKLEASILVDQEKATAINQKLANSGAALYGWLSKNKPGWEDSVGKTISEQILFDTTLNPKIAHPGNSFFGVEIELKDLPVKVKTLAAYQSELNRLGKNIK